MKKLLYISLVINCLALIVGAYAMHRLGGWKNLKYKIENRGLTNKYEQRKSLFKEMPGRDSSIVFLGNSITQQCEWAELFGNPYVINRGISGDHCDGVRERLSDIKKLNPSKIFLMIGINDLAFHPPEIVLEKYTQLLAEILQQFPSTTLYLQSVLPVNNAVSPVPIENADIRTLNSGIKKLAENDGLTFIDLHPLLLDPNGSLDAQLTLDGLHLNGKAYLIWKNHLIENYKL